MISKYILAPLRKPPTTSWWCVRPHKGSVFSVDCPTIFGKFDIFDFDIRLTIITKMRKN